MSFAVSLSGSGRAKNGDEKQEEEEESGGVKHGVEEKVLVVVEVEEEQPLTTAWRSQSSAMKGTQTKLSVFCLIPLSSLWGRERERERDKTRR